MLTPEKLKSISAALGELDDESFTQLWTLVVHEMLTRSFEVKHRVPHHEKPPLVDCDPTLRAERGAPKTL